MNKIKLFLTNVLIVILMMIVIAIWYPFLIAVAIVSGILLLIVGFFESFKTR